MALTRRILLAGSFAGLASCFALPAYADEAGTNILREAFQKLYQARSMTAELTAERKVTGRPNQIRQGKIALQKPNLLSISLTEKNDKRTRKQTYVSDGKFYFTYMEGFNSVYPRGNAGKAHAVHG